MSQRTKILLVVLMVALLLPTFACITGDDILDTLSDTEDILDEADPCGNRAKRCYDCPSSCPNYSSGGSSGGGSSTNN